MDPARRVSERRVGHGSGSTTRCCRSTPRSASSTATPTVDPETLVLWEAQFGDFINCAQVIIDQYIVAAEDKWGQRNGLVLLLPHGYEGQGPEHSRPASSGSSQLAAEDNIQVCNATTAAQFFHLLRRQVLHRAAHAADHVHAEAGPADEADPLADRRAHPRLVPGDRSTTRASATRRRAAQSCSAAARWRGTRWPSATSARHRSPSCGSSSCTRRRSSRLDMLLATYPNARELVWLQEEPENMGGWKFVESRTGGSRSGLRHPPRRPRRVRQPGHRLQGHPRPGARRPHGRDLPGL